MNAKRLLATAVVILGFIHAVPAQTVLANWTFETSHPSGTPGNGVWITNIFPEIGSGVASANHAGNAVYSSPIGNGSSHSFSSTVWTNAGDCYQFAISTLGFQSISLTWDQTSSGTGPTQFYLAYSTNGTDFTTFTYYSLSPISWFANSTNFSSRYSFDLSSVPDLNNAPVVYFRLVCTFGVTSTVGTSRIDNVIVTGLGLDPFIITNPQSTNIFVGDTVNFRVIATGSSPPYYQWYYTNSNTPLTDGSSGHGAGMISGTTSDTLTLSYLDASQAGGYLVVVTNSANSITSVVAQLTIATRTPITTNIGYLRTLQDPVNWVPSDHTNLFSVTGVVTTPFNLTTLTNAEFFIQDGIGGIAVFVANVISVPNQGDRVQVVGPLGEFHGLLELNLDANNPTHSVSAPLSTGNPLPSPIQFNFTSATNIPLMETNVEGSLVVVSNVFIEQPPPFFAGNTVVILTNADGQEFSLYVNLNDADVVNQPVPAFAASITGVMGQFTADTPSTNGYELDVLRYADLVPNDRATIPMTIQRVGTNAVVSWDGSLFSLQSATNVTGPYMTIDGVVSPYTNALDKMDFFRLVR